MKKLTNYIKINKSVDYTLRKEWIAEHGDLTEIEAFFSSIEEEEKRKSELRRLKMERERKRKEREAAKKAAERAAREAAKKAAREEEKRRRREELKKKEVEWKKYLAEKKARNNLAEKEREVEETSKEFNSWLSDHKVTRKAISIAKKEGRSYTEAREIIFKYKAFLFEKWVRLQSELQADYRRLGFIPIFRELGIIKRKLAKLS